MPTPSLILVPARFKSGKLYTQVATTTGGVALGSSGDFNVTRALNTATRVNENGLIESVASGIPRLDYFASGGVVGCPALLVEPSAANLAYNSTDTRTSWTLGANLSSGYVDVIGVSGNNLTVVSGGSSIGLGAGRNGRNSFESLVSGGTYTFSFLMKKTGNHTIGGYYIAFVGGEIGAGFDVSGSFNSGSIYNSGVTNRVRRVEQFGVDVYRVSETFTATSGGAIFGIFLAPLSAVNSQNNPSAGNGIAFAAPQLELGSVPTSFIPTVGSQVTRNADVISLSGAVSGCIGQTQGTIYAEVDIRNIVGVYRIPILISDGTANPLNGALLEFSNLSAWRAALRANNSQIFTISGPTSQPQGIYKVALGYKSGDSVLYVNGTQVATSAASFTFAASLTVTNLYGASAGNNVFNDRIRAVALYTTRLSDPELQTLTQL